MRAAIRGGNFNNAGNAGVFALNVNNAPSNANNNIGFRAGKARDITKPDGRDNVPVCSAECFGITILTFTGEK
jgi:hypothetical protein